MNSKAENYYFKVMNLVFKMLEQVRYQSGKRPTDTNQPVGLL
jgi:hypothetical protein